MKYLAIDSSGEYLTVIAVNEEIKRIFYSPKCGVKHSENLMIEVENAVVAADLDLNDVDFFAAAVGPGSFTGIRIGVSTIKGFADAYKKPVLAVTTLDAIAYTESVGKRLAVINAKHGCFYVAGYDGQDLVLEPEFVNTERLLELEKEYELLVYEHIDGLLAKIVDVAEGLSVAINKKAHLKSLNTDDLCPFYLRLSQAEEGRK